MKKLIIKIGTETHELPYNGEVFSFEVSDKYVPNVGDCVRVDWEDSTFGFECSYFKVVDKKINIYYGNSLDLKYGKLNIDLTEGYFYSSLIFTQITPEELKAKYAEAGYDWDYETNEVKPLKWMPKDRDEVWYLTELFKVANKFYDNNYDYHNYFLEKGLLFPTEAECQKFADHCLKYFDKK